MENESFGKTIKNLIFQFSNSNFRLDTKVNKSIIDIYELIAQMSMNESNVWKNKPRYLSFRFEKQQG
jgi:hypothetical protein